MSRFRTCRGPMHRVAWRLALAAAVAGGAVASAQSIETADPEADPEGNGPPVRELTLFPRLVAEPLLEHRLMPLPRPGTSGDAVPLLYRANELLTQNLDDERMALLRGVPESPTPEQADELLAQARPTLDELHLLARQPRTAWNLALDQRAEWFAVLVPELQQVRDLGRLLALDMGRAADQGRFGDALAAHRAVVRLGQMCGEGDFLISYLVGVAVTQLGLHELQGWGSHAEAPNLYWPVAALPRDVVPTGPALRGEYVLVRGFFGRMEDAAAEQASDWTDRLWRFDRQAQQYRSSQESSSLSDAAAEEKAVLTRAALRLMRLSELLAQVPAARRTLRDFGHEPQALDRMQPAEILLAASREVWRRTTDERFKLAFAPAEFLTPQRLQESERRIERLAAADPLVVAGLVSVAVPSVRTSGERLRTRIDLLQLVEAMRHHAARHGHWPADLADLELPWATGRSAATVAYRRTAPDRAEITTYLDPDDHSARSVQEILRLKLAERP